MAYVSANLKAAGATLRGDEQEWVYDTDATDVAATVQAAGFIDDGLKKGLRVGQCMKIREWVDIANRMNPLGSVDRITQVANHGIITAVTICHVTAVDNTTNTDGDVTLSAGVAI